MGDRAGGHRRSAESLGARNQGNARVVAPVVHVAGDCRIGVRRPAVWCVPDDRCFSLLSPPAERRRGSRTVVPDVQAWRWRMRTVSGRRRAAIDARGCRTAPRRRCRRRAIDRRRLLMSRVRCSCVAGRPGCPTCPTCRVCRNSSCMTRSSTCSVAPRSATRTAPLSRSPTPSGGGEPRADDPRRRVVDLELLNGSEAPFELCSATTGTSR